LLVERIAVGGDDADVVVVVLVEVGLNARDEAVEAGDEVGLLGAHAVGVVDHEQQIDERALAQPAVLGHVELGLGRGIAVAVAGIAVAGIAVARLVPAGGLRERAVVGRLPVVVVVLAAPLDLLTTREQRGEQDDGAGPIHRRTR